MNERNQRKQQFLGLALLIGATTGIVVMLVIGFPKPAVLPKADPSGDLDFPVPDFQLTERSGKTISRADLQGDVWIAAFVFTRCKGPCPQVTATMAKLQKELDLKNTAGLRFVTFTVDPERDDPKELRDYANNFLADPEKWYFLTGDEASIHNLLQKGFKVTARRKDKPEPGDEYEHSTKLAVVDKAGRIREYANGIESLISPTAKQDYLDGLERLKAKVRQLLQE
jgi:protein SCO1